MPSPLITIVPYDHLWPHIFEEEAKRLRKALGDNCLQIHHIGSTSVPGLAAKPIIDIIPVVKDCRLSDMAIQGMKDLGYDFKGEFGIPFRRFFCKPGYNVHIYEEGSSEIDRHLKFRDYLRHNAQKRDQYAHIKQELAQQFPNDKIAYILGKDPFIQTIDQASGYQGLRMVQALLPREWRDYHRIRKEEIFNPAHVPYDEDHWTLSADNHIHFVLIYGTTTIGAAQIEFLLDNEAILRPFAIDSAYQRQGYGMQFLQMIERWLSHQGKTVLYLQASHQAVPFYEKNGYTPSPFDDPDDESLIDDCVDMKKILFKKSGLYRY
jgi:GrpB-like predicted nucleotidyltransferase (UPF0157 family)